MNNRFLPGLLITLGLLAFSFTINAQAPFKYLTHIFPVDSLAGFDQKAADQEALQRGFFGSEYHVIMYHMKRDFINKKYGYYTGSGNSMPPGSNAKGPSTNSINAAPCVNEDFESSPSSTSTTTVGTIGTSLLGWQVSWGQNSGVNGSCLQSGCCPNPGSTDAWIRQTPWTAPAPLGVIPNSPFGGTKVIQMNDNITAKGEVVRIQQTFPVTPSNALFQFAYMAAMNGSGHLCCDQPYIRVELLDCMNNILACPQVSITPPGPSCATVSAVGWATNSLSISYTPSWIIKAIDLSPYLGSCVTIKITVGDCDGWAHYGYAFFDCRCLPMTVTVNNIQFPAGNAIVNVAGCGISTATMVAPPGLGPYTWNGPPGSGITANPNQTITTTTPGNYTLTMNPIGICTPITKTVNLQFGTFPTAGFSVTNSCTTYTITNTGTGPPSVQTYSFAGPGGPSSFTTTNATSVVNFAPSSTYTIYQVVTNPQNCPSTFSMVINTPPGPSPAFTAAPSWTQCLAGNAFTFNATTAAGSHTFAFIPTVGAPPTGFTNPYGPVSFTAPGNYTVVHTINSAGCVSTTQSVVVVNSAPTASILSAIAPPCAGASATLTGAGGPGVLSWAGPAGWTGVGLSAMVNNFQTVNNGIYTLTVNNFGCITTTTAQLTLSVQPTATVSNSGPVCLGSPVSFSASIPAGASYWYWYRPTPYYYGGYMIATPTIAVTTATTAGTYTFYVGFPGCPLQVYTTNVVVVTPTTPTVTNTGPYCAGQTIQLNATAGAGSTFTWSGPAAFTSTLQNPTRPNATTAMSGVYTVTAGVGSCKTTGTTNVVVNPSPTVVIGSNSPVCIGNPINLTSSGGTTYTWSGPGGYSSTVQNPTLTPSTAAMAGVYTVTVSNASGCKSTGTVNVTLTTATTTAANTGPYCAGQTISLSTPAAATYTWTGPNAFTSNAQNPNIVSSTTLMSGVYTVTSSTGGCKATATTNVIVNAAPTPTASNTGPYCPGNTIQLNVGAFSTYTWSGPSAFSSNAQNATQANAQTTNSGNYTVIVTSAQGCTNTAVTNVVVNPTPTVGIGSNSPICLNSALNLTSSGGTGYSWSGPNAFTSALQNPNIPAATAVNAGIYTVTVTALGCSNTGTVNVTVTTPTTSAANTGPYCVGSTMQLNAPVATSYTWNGPGGFTSNAQSPTAPVTLASAGSYNLLVTIGTCTANATTTVVVNPLPTPVANNTGAYCPGNTIQLNVGAFSTYTWSGPSAFSSNSQNPTSANAQAVNAGVYTVTVTDANGCINSATTNVVVNPNPVPVLGSNSPVCINSSINLTVTGGTGYSWSGPNAFTSALQNPTIPSALAVNAGVYTVTVTALGCTGIGTINVVVTTPTTSASNAGPFCVGSTMQLSAPAASSYTWSGPGGFTSNAQNPIAPGVTMAMAGSYSVLVSIGSCTANAATNVLVNPLPTPVANNTGAYCPGNTIQLNVGAFNTYTWSGPSAFSSNAQSPTQTNAQTTNSGIYTVMVTDANGCVNSATTNVTVNPNPVAVLGSNSPVCINTSINLTANGGTSYSWSGPNGFNSSTQNPTIPNATTLEAGIYTVTVTALGCTGIGTINVAVVNPTTSAANTGPYCAGATINLSAPAASSYTWSGPGAYSSNAQNATQPGSTPLMSGTYTVIVSVGTCTAMATTNVVVNALPVPNAVSNSPVCIGQSINLTGSGGTTYTWTGPASFNSNSSTPSIPTATNANAGNYALTVMDANGCINSTNVNVVVNNLPVIAVNNPTNCVNTTIGLTATGGTAYAWTGPGGFTSGNQNPTIPSAQLSNAGAYVVTVTDVNGCMNTAVANASVVALPVPNANVASAVCVGATLNFIGSGGSTYTWTGPGSFSSNQQNPNIPSASLAAGGTYTLLVSANTCTASTTVAAVVNPLPTPNIVTNSPLCVGDVLNLTGSGGVNYLWTGPGGFTSTNQNPNVPSVVSGNSGNYVLTVTDANGCVNSTNANVTINALPTPVANGLSLCENASGSLSSSGGTSYAWSGPGGFTSSLQNPLISTAQMANAGQYTVVVTNANNCSNTAVANLVVNPAPVPNIITNSPICINSVLSLQGTGGVTYNWSGPNGFFSTSQTATINANSLAYTGNYNLTVTDVNGCSASTSAAAVINGIPNMAIAASNNVGCAPICVTFSCTTSASVQNYGWTMGNGQGGNNASVAQGCYGTAGIYTINTTVVDVNGCMNTATYTVEVYPQPVADFNHAPIKPIVNIDQEVVFTDASWNTPIVSWNWYFMNTGQYTSTQQNPTFSYTEPGTYAVALVVKSDKGCTDTIVRPLVVGEDFGIYVPNAFTPNNDGLNDFFQPKGFGITKYELNIFDRWGERVFHTSNFTEGWDGTFQNRGDKIIEEGVYTWLINCTSVFGKAHELKGHVTLIR